MEGMAQVEMGTRSDGVGMGMGEDSIGRLDRME